MEIPDKGELQQMPSNHSILVNDTTLPSGNLLWFSKNLL